MPHVEPITSATKVVGDYTDESSMCQDMRARPSRGEEGLHELDAHGDAQGGRVMGMSYVQRGGVVVLM
jgi:hypothetical protein